MVVPGIDGETAPQLFDSFQPEFITGVHKFEYDPLNIVDEHASPETVTQVAIKLLDYLEGLSGSGEGELFMLFAYDLGGVIIQEVVPPLDEYYHNLAYYERRSLLHPGGNTARFSSGLA